MPQAIQTMFESWRDHVHVREIAAPQGHCIHSYFNACPESPDGSAVVVFLSTDPEGHIGDVAVIGRVDGQVRRLASGVTAEDAHRQAYQQWCDGGRKIVYQDLRDGQWQVVVVDVATGHAEVAATGRQLGIGSPTGQVVPLHGPHWSPGEHRHFELLDVVTGQVRQVLTWDRVAATYGDWLAPRFVADRPMSIFFPVLSPDGTRAFFKPAQAKDGIFRSKTASTRDGLMVFDLASDRLLMCRDKWGHPAWHPNNRTIITPQNVLIDSDTGSERVIAGLPEHPGSHPGFHPSGHLAVTDRYMRGENVPRGWWAVAVLDPAAAALTHVHELHELPGGATSWRPPHPHPVFSHDGRRLYFNVSAGQWTRLHVAEVRPG